jgi:hypothetical protein
VPALHDGEGDGGTVVERQDKAALRWYSLSVRRTLPGSDDERGTASVNRDGSTRTSNTVPFAPAKSRALVRLVVNSRSVKRPGLPGSAR